MSLKNRIEERLKEIGRFLFLAIVILLISAYVRRLLNVL